jgi:hypothetical protein
MAQAGGPDASKAAEAIAIFKQVLLEQPVKDGVERASRHPGWMAGKLGKAVCNSHDHVLEQLVDLEHFDAERVFKQRLGAKIIPKAMHVRFVTQSFAELGQEPINQFVLVPR